MPKPGEWQGSVFLPAGRTRLRIKVWDGTTWRKMATSHQDTPEGWAAARTLLAGLREALNLRHAVVGEAGGAVTVRAWARRWLADRHALGVDDRHGDDGIVATHVLPAIGHMPLEEVRPRHLVELVTRLRGAGRAPRTVRNVYSVVRAMFREAMVQDLVRSSPCVLTHHHLGKVRDARPGWRGEAVFSREELARLISDDRIPADRRVWYALLGLGMLRTGEAAGLRWRAVVEAEPLGRLAVTTSYDRGRTKTEAERWMPIHPTLAAVLAEWRLGGWAKAFGRAPGADDLVCPIIHELGHGRRSRSIGAMRDRHYSRKRFVVDLAKLGLRHRRVHDLRRTGISLARAAGADRDVLRRGTHAPPRDVMELYTSVEWERLCAEVARLRVERRGTSVVPLWSPEAARRGRDKPQVRRKRTVLVSRKGVT